MEMMESLKHENIIGFVKADKGLFDMKDGSKAKQVYYILMELAPNGELFDIIQSTGKFSEPTARHCFMQLLKALSYMHNTNGVVHLDIKPENIFVSEDFKMKLGDLGFSKSAIDDNGNSKMTTIQGTVGYMAPEILGGKLYTGKNADLFALAVVLFIMVTGFQPFDNAKTNDTYYKFIAGNKPSLYWNIFKQAAPVSDELKDLITGMLQLDPSARLSFEEILAHPWLMGPVPSQLEVNTEFTLRMKKGTTTTT